MKRIIKSNLKTLSGKRAVNQVMFTVNNDRKVFVSNGKVIAVAIAGWWQVFITQTRGKIADRYLKLFLNQLEKRDYYTKYEESQREIDERAQWILED